MIDLGIDVDLRAVYVGDDGSVFVCGNKGTACHYENGKVRTFLGKPDRDFGGVCQFRGDVYFGAGAAGVEILNANNEIVPFKPNVHSQRLSVNQQFLWACGGNEICRFDGTAWVAEAFG